MVASTSLPSEPAVYLRSLTLHGFRAFADGTRIDFTRDDGRPAQWTILLGENGTGKTAVLQAFDLSQLREYAHRDAVALEAVPRHLIDAVIVAEDPQFFELESTRISQQLPRTIPRKSSYRSVLIDFFLAHRIAKNFRKRS